MAGGQRLGFLRQAAMAVLRRPAPAAAIGLAVVWLILGGFGLRLIGGGSWIGGAVALAGPLLLLAAAVGVAYVGAELSRETESLRDELAQIRSGSWPERRRTEPRPPRSPGGDAPPARADIRAREEYDAGAAPRPLGSPVPAGTVEDSPPLGVRAEPGASGDASQAPYLASPGTSGRRPVSAGHLSATRDGPRGGSAETSAPERRGASPEPAADATSRHRPKRGEGGGGQAVGDGFADPPAPFRARQPATDTAEDVPRPIFASTRRRPAEGQTPTRTSPRQFAQSAAAAPGQAAPARPRSTPRSYPPADREADPTPQRGTERPPAPGTGRQGEARHEQEAQRSLPLAPQAGDGAPPLPLEVVLSALNFPEDPEDRAGFRALRLALSHRDVRGTVQAAQDALTLMAEDGVYMDDLLPQPGPPPLWRRFAKGERSAETRGIGEIDDAARLEALSDRLRRDPVFRDAAHHFLRRLDRLLTAIEPEASDRELAAFAQTRSGKAFMALGRASGMLI